MPTPPPKQAPWTTASVGFGNSFSSPAEPHGDDGSREILFRPLARQAVQPVDIGACLKVFAGTADDQRPHSVIAGKPLQRCGQCAQQIFVIGIGNLGPVQRQRRDAAHIGRQQEAVATHGAATLAGSVLAPHTSTPTRASAGGTKRAAQQCSQRGRAARLRNQPEPIPDQPLRRGDRRHPAPAPQRRRSAWAIGNISPPTWRAPRLSAASPANWCLDRPPGRQRIMQRRDSPSGSTLITLRTASVPGGDAANQPAAAGRHQDMRQIRRILFELAADGALPGQHIRVVVGVHFQCAGFCLPGARCGQRLGIGRARLHHSRAIAGDARDLRRAVSARARKSPPWRPAPAPHRRPPPHGCHPTPRSRRRAGNSATAAD